MADQPGKDTEGGGKPINLRDLYDDVLPAGKLFITVTDITGEDHHVIVPIPKSYEAAMAIAFDRLSRFIPAMGGALPLDGAYFKYRTQSPGGDGVIWPQLPAEFWKEIVKDGDQIKLSFRPREQFAKLLMYNTKPEEFYVVVPTPKSYTGAIQLAWVFFGGQTRSNVNKNSIQLFLKTTDPTGPGWKTELRQDNWVSTLELRDNLVEIGMKLRPHETY